ncbi:MAG: hypothetical protein NTX87_08040, partial [Planctomycetota bacterium]|nr:hypothetical protein [Planctomycetota bacterium]
MENPFVILFVFPTIGVFRDDVRGLRDWFRCLEQRFEPVELAEVVRSAADLFRPHAEEKGLTLEVHAESAIVSGMRNGLGATKTGGPCSSRPSDVPANRLPLPRPSLPPASQEHAQAAQGQQGQRGGLR